MRWLSRILAVSMLGFFFAPWWDRSPGIYSGLGMLRDSGQCVLASLKEAYNPPSGTALPGFWFDRRTLLALAFFLSGVVAVLAGPRNTRLPLMGAMIASAGLDSLIVYGATLSLNYPANSDNWVFNVSNACGSVPFVIAALAVALVFARKKAGVWLGWLLVLVGASVVVGNLVLWGAHAEVFLTAVIFALEARRWDETAPVET